MSLAKCARSLCTHASICAFVSLWSIRTRTWRLNSLTLNISDGPSTDWKYFGFGLVPASYRTEWEGDDRKVSWGCELAPPMHLPATICAQYSRSLGTLKIYRCKEGAGGIMDEAVVVDTHTVHPPDQGMPLCFVLLCDTELTCELSDAAPPVGLLSNPSVQSTPDPEDAQLGRRADLSAANHIKCQFYSLYA